MASVLLWRQVFPLYCCDKTLEGEELREERFTSARGLRGVLSQDGREGVVEQSCRQEGRGVGLHITVYQEAERGLAPSQRQVEPSKPAPSDLLPPSRSHLESP